MSATLKVELSEDQLAALADLVAARIGGAEAPAGRKLLSFPEAAKELGVSSATIRRRVDAGIIATVPGFSDKISPRELDRLLGANDR